MISYVTVNGKDLHPKDWIATVMHEFLHVLGLAHMHKRVDGAKGGHGGEGLDYNYVSRNMLGTQDNAFQLSPDPTLNPCGVNFAFDSIMNYQPCVDSKQECWSFLANHDKRATPIMTLQPTKDDRPFYDSSCNGMGQRCGLAPVDKQILYNMYQNDCGGTLATSRMSSPQQQRGHGGKQ